MVRAVWVAGLVNGGHDGGAVLGSMHCFAALSCGVIVSAFSDVLVGRHYCEVLLV